MRHGPPSAPAPSTPEEIEKELSVPHLLEAFDSEHALNRVIALVRSYGDKLPPTLPQKLIDIGRHLQVASALVVNRHDSFEHRDTLGPLVSDLFDLGKDVERIGEEVKDSELHLILPVLIALRQHYQTRP